MPSRVVEEMPPDLITITEAARRLGISVDTAKKLYRAGEFPGDAAFKIGRQLRVSVPRLERVLHGEATP